MGMIFLVVLGVIFFVIGVSMIYRGMAESPEADAVVAKNEFELVKGKLDLAQKEEEGLKLQLDSMTVELQGAKTLAEGAEKVRKDVDFLRERDRQHQAMIHQLEENLNFLARKADAQAKKAIDAIVELSQRNKTLESEIKDQLGKASDQDVDDLKKEKQSIEEKLQENIAKIEQLQHELESVQKKSDAELTDAAVTIEKLRLQNKAFEEGITKITGKISIVENEFSRAQMDKDQQLQNAMGLIEGLRKEQAALREQGRGPEDVAALESELNRIKAESEGRLAAAHQNIGRLQEEVGRLQGEIQENQRQRAQLQRQIDENSRMIADGDEALKKKEGSVEEKERLWAQEKQNMDQEFLELKEANQFLRQKERLLSQELLRSQTQALGLEKICQEFKKRIERQ
jgi:chromosome segregation ATPase